MTITKLNSLFLNRTKVRSLLEFSSHAWHHFHQCGVDLISAACPTLPVCLCGTSSVLCYEAIYEGTYEYKAKHMNRNAYCSAEIQHPCKTTEN